MLGGGLIVSRFVHYAAVLALFGGALFPIYAGSGLPSTEARLAAWLRHTLAAAAILGLASGVAWFLLTAASMAGDLKSAIDLGVLATVVRSTNFGPLWLARLALILLALLTLWKKRNLPERTVSAVSGLAVAALAATGHARIPGGWGGAFHALADATHLLAAGAWLGGLWPLGVCLVWARRTPDTTDDLDAGRMLSRFSGIGLAAVSVLVISGVVNSAYLVGSLDGLFASDYGRLLLAKVVLFMAMATLAAANRFWITPALLSGQSAGDPRWLVRMRRHVLFEQILGIGVLAVVSVLGTMEPSAG
jgi:putative copper resistance protein D